MEKPILTAKVRNLFRGNQYTFKLKNVDINGVKKGCTGFIQNRKTGKIVYINTDTGDYEPIANKVLVRTADSFTDYTGGLNQYSSFEELASFITNMLDD